MKKIIYLLVICISVFFAGCKDDDLQKQVDELEQRVITLETLCAQMNTNISSIQTIIEALKQQDYITGVNPVEENTVVIGYTITFAKNKPITIYNGENGSFLGARKDSDGVYYWVLDGDWLFDDDGEKMQVSGVTPQLKIENGRWFVSIDTGKTWNDVGQATGESFFKEVDNSAEDFVRFVFADGSEIQVPKKTTFAISFSETLPVKITAGETVEIAYTLSQGNEKTLVKAMTSNGWKATVNKKDNLSGTLSITAPTPITDDEVLVFISDGKEKTVMSAISFCIVILENVQDNTVKVGGSGGDLNLEVTSNMAIQAVSKTEWIGTNEQSKSRALVTNNFRFTIKANEGELNRTGYIEVRDIGGKVLKTITVIQGNALEEEIAKEREALIALYYATNGDQWKNNTNWCSDKPLNEWYGVSGSNGHVESLLLSENKLSGSIPMEIGSLQNLTYLNLTQNELSGNIPSSIGKLENLTTLALEANKLTGSIPIEIGDLSNLAFLLLSHNELSGNIPVALGKLEKLMNLSLQKNNLTGSIPSEIGNLSNLNNLTLSENQLSGNIPSSIGKLENLTSLHLGWNQLTGNIPTTLGDLINLTDFQLGDNQLTGNIPPEICRYKNLESFYIGGNNLTGNLPEEFANIMYANPGVWGNCLTGEIPIVITEHPNWSSRAPFILPQKEGYGLTFTAYASTDYSEDGKIVKLQQATEGKGVNIVLLGDGFTDRDFASGKYDKVMQQAKENLFNTEPMKSFRHLFNVYTVKAVSKNNVFIEGYETVFNGWFDGIVSAGGDHEKCQEYASKINGINLSETVILVVMNSLVHAGSNYWIDNGPGISYLPTENGHESKEFAQLIHHEVIGHAFARFADEYWYDQEAAMPDSEREVLKESHSKGWWLNVDMTNNLSEILWSKFIVDERYANEQLGAYEGAFLCAKNIYRATENSIMVANTGGFNAQQREVIYKRIMKLAYGDSWQYDYEKFVEYDAINCSSIPKLLRRTAEIPKDFKPLPPPVIIYK